MVAAVKNILREVKKVTRDSLYLYHYYRQQVDDTSILLESKHGADLSDNIFYILKELHNEHPQYTLYLAVTKESREKIKALLAYYNLDKVICVQANWGHYCKVVTRAKYLFNDTSFRQFIIKKPDQIYTNTWHGTPLKRMGDDDFRGRYDSGNIKRNLVSSDYLLFPSPEARKKMMRAYGLDQLYKGTILECGYPRNAVLLDREAEVITRKRFGLEGKRIVVYMPTWREPAIVEASGQKNVLAQHLQAIDEGLNDGEILFAKLHILDQGQIDFAHYENIRPFPSSVECYEFLNIADVLITDYSSVFFDFANTGKKIILFPYDLKAYEQGRGFYYALDALPFPLAYSAEDVLFHLGQPKDYDDGEFRRKFCTYDAKDSTAGLLRYVLNGQQADSIRIGSATSNGKVSNLLYFCLEDYAQSEDGLPIENENENLFYSFKSCPKAYRKFQGKDLPEESHLFPLAGELRPTLRERVALFLFYRAGVKVSLVKKLVDRAFDREIIRFFQGVDFNSVSIQNNSELWAQDLLQRLAIIDSQMMGKEGLIRKNE